MTIKRYNPTVTLMDDDIAVVQMIPHDEGIVVRWEDHAQAFEDWQAAARKAEQLLLEEIEQLRGERTRASFTEVVLEDHLDSADAELLKLRAERDAAIAELERRTAWWDDKVAKISHRHDELAKAVQDLEIEAVKLRATRRPTLNEMVLQIAAEGYAVISVT